MTAESYPVRVEVSLDPRLSRWLWLVNWMVVVMNRDATPSLTVRASAGATVPALPWIAAGLLGGGVLLAVRRTSAPAPVGPGPPARAESGQAG